MAEKRRQQLLIPSRISWSATEIKNWCQTLKPLLCQVRYMIPGSVIFISYQLLDFLFFKRKIPFVQATCLIAFADTSDYKQLLPYSHVLFDTHRCARIENTSKIISIVHYLNGFAGKNKKMLVTTKFWNWITIQWHTYFFLSDTWCRIQAVKWAAGQ